MKHGTKNLASAGGATSISRSSTLARVLRVSAPGVLLAVCAVAADTSPALPTAAENAPASCLSAVLRNGFSIRYARYEIVSGTTRLWMCADAGAGYVEVPTEQIEQLGQNQGEVSAPPSSGIAGKAASNTVRARDPIGNLITSAASRYQIDADFITSVVKAESGFNPKAVSPKGARGLMQLMPNTAAGLGIENILDPADNVDGGTKYLRELLDRYDGDALKALAAYNAGPQRVAQYGGVPPFRETQGYIIRIIEDYNRKKQQQADSTPH